MLKITKNIFITFSTLVLSFNCYSMDSKKKDYSKKIVAPINPDNNFPFTALPTEVQKLIIISHPYKSESTSKKPAQKQKKPWQFDLQLLQKTIKSVSQQHSSSSKKKNAPTDVTLIALKHAAYTIHSLSNVNHHLRKIINDPQFCLHIIKRLSQNCSCSNEIIAQILQTPESRERLTNQSNLLKEFSKLSSPSYSIDNFNNFCLNHSDRIDFDFTYLDKETENHNSSSVPLWFLMRYDTVKLNCLLNIKTVNVNIPSRGNTLLMFLADYGHYHDNYLALLKQLCQHPKININQQNFMGQTAILVGCNGWELSGVATKIINLLLNAGADPEIADYDGNTCLQLLEHKGNRSDVQNAISLIKDAIDKKHTKTNTIVPNSSGMNQNK